MIQFFVWEPDCVNMYSKWYAGRKTTIAGFEPTTLVVPAMFVLAPYILLGHATVIYFSLKPQQHSESYTVIPLLRQHILRKQGTENVENIWIYKKHPV